MSAWQWADKLILAMMYACLTVSIVLMIIDVADPKGPSMAGKRYSGGRNPQTLPRVPFELAIWREDTETGETREEVHEFVARPQFSGADMSVMTTEGDNRQAHALMKIISKALDDRDGVSARWKAEPLKPQILIDETVPAYAGQADEVWPTSGGPVEAPARERTMELNYRGPDGRIHPYSDTAKLDAFRAFENGSSRRRWDQLLFEEPDVIVEFPALVEIMKDLMQEAAGRPTTAR